MAAVLADVRKPPILSPVQLIGDAVARVRAGGARFWALWSVYAIVQVAGQVGAQAAGIKLQSFSLAAIGCQLLLAAICGLNNAVSLRLLVRSPKAWLRLDRRLLATAGLLMAAQLTIDASEALLASSHEGADFEAAPYFVGLTWYVANILVLSKLALWPLGLVSGRPDMSMARALRMMRRTARSLIGAMVLLSLPVAIAYYIGFTAFGLRSAAPPLLATATLALAGTAVELLGQGVVASIYERRGQDPETLAEVFA